MAQYHGQHVSVMRYLEPDEEAYDENEIMVEVTMDDGTKHVVKRDEVKSDEATVEAPKAAPASQLHTSKDEEDDDEPSRPKVHSSPKRR